MRKANLGNNDLVQNVKYLIKALSGSIDSRSISTQPVI